MRAAPAARGRLPRRGHTTGVRPAIGVAGNHHHGVVSGNRTQDGVHATLVNRGGQELSRTRRGTQHRDVRRTLGGNQQLLEQGNHAGVRRGAATAASRIVRNSVNQTGALIADALGSNFNEIAGKGGLSNLHTVVGQVLRQFSLGTYTSGLQQLNDAGLTRDLGRGERHVISSSYGANHECGPSRPSVERVASSLPKIIHMHINMRHKYGLFSYL